PAAAPHRGCMSGPSSILLAGPEVTGDLVPQLLEPDGLDDVVVRAGAETFLLVGEVAARGEHDDTDIAEVGVVLDGSRDLPTVDLGHHDIEEDQGGPGFFEFGEGLAAVDGGDDAIPLRF